MQTTAQKILNEIQKAISGKEQAVTLCVTAMLAGGHLLIEDLPGVGKTTLAKALARSARLRVKRVQFTPDTLPSDITGFTMWDAEMNRFRFHEGAVMTNILVADEINRTSPRTQSALLQAMEEGAVSEEGETLELEKPFMVIATQNPLGSAGTMPLPQSQLDRFMMKISLGRPEKEVLSRLLIERTSAEKPDISAVCEKADIITMQKNVEQVYLSMAAADWIAELAEKTHSDERLLQGASPRAAISLARSAKAAAFISGRDFVVPDDIAGLFTVCTAHRLILSESAVHSGITAERVCEDILSSTPAPHIKGGSK